DRACNQRITHPGPEEAPVDRGNHRLGTSAGRARVHRAGHSCHSRDAGRRAQARGGPSSGRRGAQPELNLTAENCLEPALNQGESMTTAAFLVDGVRTPQGRYGGVLAGIRADDLAAQVVAAVVDRAGVDPANIDEVVLGAANQGGEDNRNVARMAVLLAGLPDTVPGFTVNRLCASGLQAVASAAQAVRVGDADLSVAGGVESMTRAPWVLEKPSAAWSRPGEV